jgi:hypothetical protein
LDKAPDKTACPRCEANRAKQESGEQKSANDANSFGHDFTRIPLHASSSIPKADQTKSSEASPGPDQDVTQPPATPAGPSPGDGGTFPADAGAKTNKAKLKSGPKYTPSGTIKATKSGGSKSATFKLGAEFENDPASNILASCGEVRQYIMWTKDADIPNHDGFKPKANFSANTWYEDRDDVGKRYGHRSGTFSECVSINHYEDKAGTKDCANGAVFVGRDDPMDGSGAKTGLWKFELRAVDTCDGDKEIGTAASVDIDWNV